MNFKGAGNVAGLDNEFSVDKTVSLDGVTCPGADAGEFSVPATIRYCYEVVNSGGDSLNNVTLVDDSFTSGQPGDDVALPLAMSWADAIGGSGSTSGVTLQPSGSAYAVLDVPITSSGQYTNVVTASADDTTDVIDVVPIYAGVSPEPPTTTTTTVAPTTTTTPSGGRLEVDMTFDESTIDTPEVGAEVRLELVMRNSGGAELREVVPVVTNAALVSCTPSVGAELEPGESMVCVLAHELTEEEISSGVLGVQVLATSLDTSDNPVEGQAPLSVTIVLGAAEAADPVLGTPTFTG